MEEVDKGCPMTRMGVSGWMFLLVPTYPVSPGQKATKRLCVCVCVFCSTIKVCLCVIGTCPAMRRSSHIGSARHSIHWETTVVSIALSDGRSVPPDWPLQSHSTTLLQYRRLQTSTYHASKHAVTVVWQEQHITEWKERQRGKGKVKAAYSTREHRWGAHLPV